MTAVSNVGYRFISPVRFRRVVVSYVTLYQVPTNDILGSTGLSEDVSPVTNSDLFLCSSKF